MSDLRTSIVVFIIPFLLFSCSNTDEEGDQDIIVGKWRMIEKYESNGSINIICELNSYDEFTINHTMKSMSVPTSPNITLSLCFMFPEEGFWEWQNLGDQQYRFSRANSPDQIFSVYLENNNLVLEHPDGITKTIHEPYVE